LIKFNVIRRWLTIPIYRYRCQDCDKIFTLYDFEDKICSCGSKNIEKLPSSFSINYNTDGFYKTDYADKEAK